MSQGPRVAIVGGGLAGLSAARHVARLGRHVTLFEGTGLFGGQVATIDEVDGIPVPGKFSGQDLATHLLELPLDEQNRLAQRLFRGICLSDHSAVRDLYQAALAMERQTRDRFRVLAAQLPDGAERQVCAELADKEDGHMALLEAELGLLAQAVS